MLYALAMELPHNDALKNCNRKYAAKGYGYCLEQHKFHFPVTSLNNDSNSFEQPL